jgi:hypothetical protein
MRFDSLHKLASRRGHDWRRTPLAMTFSKSHLGGRVVGIAKNPAEVDDRVHGCLWFNLKAHTEGFLRGHHQREFDTGQCLLQMNPLPRPTPSLAGQGGLSPPWK